MTDHLGGHPRHAQVARDLTLDGDLARWNVSFAIPDCRVQRRITQEFYVRPRRRKLVFCVSRIFFHSVLEVELKLFFCLFQRHIVLSCCNVVEKGYALYARIKCIFRIGMIHAARIPISGPVSVPDTRRGVVEGVGKFVCEFSKLVPEIRHQPLQRGDRLLPLRPSTRIPRDTALDLTLHPGHDAPLEAGVSGSSPRPARSLVQGPRATNASFACRPPGTLPGSPTSRSPYLVPCT